MSECPLGYFGDTAGRRCRRCHRGCETCKGKSPLQCLSCRPGFYHHPDLHTCMMNCPAGFYASKSKCMSPGPSLGQGPLSWLNVPALCLQCAPS